MTDTYTPVLTDTEVEGISHDWNCYFPSAIGGSKLCIRAIERAAIEAYQRQQWRPIETAPEGTMLLLANMNSGEARHWAFVDWLVEGKCCGNKFHSPTHWMPLPPPPEAQ